MTSSKEKISELERQIVTQYVEEIKVQCRDAIVEAKKHLQKAFEVIHELSTQHSINIEVDNLTTTNESIDARLVFKVDDEKLRRKKRAEAIKRHLDATTYKKPSKKTSEKKTGER